jgi:hypothetical protein
MWTEVQQALNQSTANLMTGLVRLVPGTIALAVSLLIAAGVGLLLSLIVKRALTGIEFDRRAAAWGWTDLGTSSAKGPTAMAARLVWWLFVFLGFLVGVAAFDPTLTSQIALRLFGSAMNLIVALVLLIVGSLFARVLSRGVLITLVNMNVQQARLVSVGVKWLVLVFAAAMAFDHLSIGGHIVEIAFAILFGGIVLALALAVGLHSKDVADWLTTRPTDQERGSGPPIDHL